MLSELHIDIIDQTQKGVITRVIASELMGPVGVLCIQRALNKGRQYGLMTGFSVTCSGIIYALLTGFGMSLVVDLITNPKDLFVLQILGSILLLLFDIYSFRNNPAGHMHVSGKARGTYLYNGITAFWLAFLSLLTILLFIAMYAQFRFAAPDHPAEMVSGYFGIFGSAPLWWYSLVQVVDKVRGKFNNNDIVTINKIIGSTIIVCSIIILIGTVFNLYTFHYQPVIIKPLTDTTSRRRLT